MNAITTRAGRGLTVPVSRSTRHPPHKKEGRGKLQLAGNDLSRNAKGCMHAL